MPLSLVPARISYLEELLHGRSGHVRVHQPHGCCARHSTARYMRAACGAWGGAQLQHATAAPAIGQPLLSKQMLVVRSKSRAVDDMAGENSWVDAWRSNHGTDTGDTVDTSTASAPHNRRQTAQPYEGTALLGKAIQHAPSLTALRHILAQHHSMLLQGHGTGHLDAVNLNILAAAIVRLTQPQPLSPYETAPRSRQDMQRQQPRQGAASTLEAEQDGVWSKVSGQAVVGEVLQQLMAIAVAIIDQLRPRQLCSILWAVARISAAVSGADAGSAPASFVAAASQGMQLPIAHSGSKSKAGGCLQQLGLEVPFQQLSAHMCTPMLLHRASPQDLALLVYAHACVGFQLPAVRQAAILPAMAQLFGRFKPQDYSMMAYALGVLQMRPTPGWLSRFAAASLQHLAHMTPQGLANTIWGLAVVGQEPRAAWLREFMRATMQTMDCMKDQELAMVAWSVAELLGPTHSQFQLGADAKPLAPSVWLSGLEAQALARAPAMSVRDMATILWSMAALRHRPQLGLMVCLAQQVPCKLGWRAAQRGSMPAVVPAEGSTSQATPAASAAASAQRPTAGHVLFPTPAPPGSPAHGAQPTPSLASRPQMPTKPALTYPAHLDVAAPWDRQHQDAHSQHGSGSGGRKYGNSRVGTVQQPSHANRPQDHKEAVSRQTLCTLLWVLARLQVVPPASLLDALVGTLGAQLHSCNAHDLSTSLFALAFLGHTPDPKWMVRFFTACRTRLRTFSPVQLSTLLAALARLRVRPARPWMEWTLMEAGRRLGEFGPDALADLMWAVGHLGYCPSAQWVAAFCSAARAELHVMNANQLWMVVHAMHKLQLRARPRGDAPSAAKSGTSNGSGAGAGLHVAGSDQHSGSGKGCQSAQLEQREVPEQWVDDLRAAVAARAFEFRPQKLHAAVHALSAMQPGHLWSVAEPMHAQAAGKGRHPEGGYLQARAADSYAAAAPGASFWPKSSYHFASQAGRKMQQQVGAITWNDGLLVDAVGIASLCLLGHRWEAQREWGSGLRSVNPDAVATLAGTRGKPKHGKKRHADWQQAGESEPV